MSILGAEVTLGRKQVGGKMESRLQECHRRIQRVTAIPGDRKWRAKLLAQCAMPTLYGLELTNVREEWVKKTRAAVWTAVRAGASTEATTAYETVFTVALKGHLLDLAQARTYQMVASWLQWYDPNTESGRRWTDIWNRRAVAQVQGNRGSQANRRLTEGGVAHTLAVKLETINWVWKEEGLQIPGEPVYAWPLGEDCRNKMKHHLREALRGRDMAKLVTGQDRDKGLKARAEFEGAEQGVNWEAARSLMDKVAPYDRGVITGILVGPTFGRGRMYRHERGQRGRVDKPSNPYSVMPTCTQTPDLETRVHMYWHCPFFDGLRRPAMKRLRDRIGELAMCFVWCGLPTKDASKEDAEEVQASMLEIERYRTEKGPNLAWPNQGPEESDPHPASGPYGWKSRRQALKEAQEAASEESAKKKVEGVEAGIETGARPGGAKTPDTKIEREREHATVARAWAKFGAVAKTKAKSQQSRAGQEKREALLQRSARDNG